MISRKLVICERSFPVEGGAFENAGYVSTQIKAVLHEMKVAEEVIRRAAIVAYEAETNMCAYAEHGSILLRVTPEQITIEARDEGQGIADIGLAMTEGFSTATGEISRMGFGAGMGLSNMKNFSDFFHIASTTGKGTYVKMVIRIKERPDTPGNGS